MLIIENSTPALIRREKLNNIAKTLIKCSEVRKSIFFKKLKFVPEIEFTVEIPTSGYYHQFYLICISIAFNIAYIFFNHRLHIQKISL